MILILTAIIYFKVNEMSRFNTPLMEDILYDHNIYKPISKKVPLWVVISRVKSTMKILGFL